MKLLPGICRLSHTNWKVLGPWLKLILYSPKVFKSTSIFYAQKLCIGDMIPTRPRRVTFGLGEEQISLSPGLEDPKLARHQQTKRVSKPSAKE